MYAKVLKINPVKCKLYKDHRGVDLVSGVLPFGRLL